MENGGKIACIRSKLRPKMRVPDGYQPELKPLNSNGGCASGLSPITLHGKKSCVKCKPDYKYHPYYGQGRCVTCQAGESLTETGGKIMCLSCPKGANLLGTYPRSGMSCVCPSPKVFGWSGRTYGCYTPAGR